MDAEKFQNYSRDILLVHKIWGTLGSTQSFSPCNTASTLYMSYRVVLCRAGMQVEDVWMALEGRMRFSPAVCWGQARLAGLRRATGLVEGFIHP